MSATNPKLPSGPLSVAMLCVLLDNVLFEFLILDVLKTLTGLWVHRYDP